MKTDLTKIAQGDASALFEKGNRPFETIRHSTDSFGKTIVDIQGIYFSNADAIKLRDELNRLIPNPERDALCAIAKIAETFDNQLAGGSMFANALANLAAILKGSK
jgi:hypothetical protein